MRSIRYREAPTDRPGWTALDRHWQTGHECGEEPRHTRREFHGFGLWRGRRRPGRKTGAKPAPAQQETNAKTTYG
jgi:hypothetical protein